MVALGILPIFKVSSNTLAVMFRSLYSSTDIP
jgi:hypothetical protein